MSICLLYRAETVGPVCQRVAKSAPQGAIKVVKEGDPLPNNTKLLVRWGSASHIHGDGVIINSSDAVLQARDKRHSRELLGDLAPKTWFEKAQIPLGASVVIRPRQHHAGNKFFVCRGSEQVRQAILKCRRGWYASELVDKAREFRVFVLQGRVICVSERFPANNTAIAWNLARGGRLINAKFKTWPIEVCKASIEACKRLGLDWGAIDVALDKKGKCYVFEANTAPGLRNPYTLKQIAKALVWTESNPAPKEVKGDSWKALLHPALKPE